MNTQEKFGENTSILWHDTKRWCGMPLTFTHYYLVEKEGQWIKLFVETGFLSTHMDETMMYKVDDFQFFESAIDKLFGVGNIKIYTNEASGGYVHLINVKKPHKVLQILHDATEKERTRRNVHYGEYQA